MRRFLLILTLFVAGTTLQAFTFPPMEGSDEPLHTAYALYLRDNGALPPRETYLENCTRQQSGQPPLLYAAGAALLTLTNIDTADCDTTFDYYFRQTNNPWLLTPRPQRADDNNTNFLPDPTQPPPTGFPSALRILRLLSVASGALAVIGAWLAAGEIFQHERTRLTVTAIFAFTPTVFHLSSYYTNDTPAIAFATFAAWGALRVLRHGVTVRRMAWIGLLVGVGGLAKVSVGLVAPAVATAVVLRLWRDRSAASVGAVALQTVRYGLMAAIPLTLTFGLWAGYGLATYGDPFGTGTHTHETLNYDPPLDWLTTLSGTPDVARTYVGLLGYANVYMSPLTYGLLGTVALVALVGGLVWIVRRPSRSSLEIAAVLLALTIATLIGFLSWYRTIFDVTGRLLTPAHLVYAVSVAGGLALLPGRRWLSLGAVAVHALATLVFTFTTLHTAYTPRLTTPDALPPLQGPSFTFDATVQLLGYNVDTDTLSGDLHTITLCWEVLAPTDRLAAYAVRYVKDGVPAANRTTIHGLGKYNSRLWEPGAVFCDAVDMAIGDGQFGAVPAEAATTYDVLVFLLDARSGDVDWSATDAAGNPVAFPVVGQVRTP
jgi:hypothetical protein